MGLSGFGRLPAETNTNMANQGPVEQLVSIGGAAQFWGVSLNTLRNWEKRGLGQPFRIGPRGDCRYPLSILLAMRRSGHAT
jgi:hypothetical protein